MPAILVPFLSQKKSAVSHWVGIRTNCTEMFQLTIVNTSSLSFAKESFAKSGEHTPQMRRVMSLGWIWDAKAWMVWCLRDCYFCNCHPVVTNKKKKRFTWYKLPDTCLRRFCNSLNSDAWFEAPVWLQREILWTTCYRSDQGCNSLQNIFQRSFTLKWTENDIMKLQNVISSHACSVSFSVMR